MNSYLGELPLAFLRWQLILSPLFLLHFWACRRGGGLSANWCLQRILILLTLLLPLLPGGGTIVFQGMETPPSAESPAVPAPLIPEGAPLNLLETGPSRPRASRIPPPPKGSSPLVGMLILAGAGLYSIRLARWHRRERRLRRNAQSSRKIGFLAVITSQEISSPFSAGLLHPRIYLPAETGLSKTQRRVVLTHEFIHIRRRHLYWSAAEGVVRHLFWFSPWSHLLARTGPPLREYLCDRQAVVKLPKRLYIETLLSMAVETGGFTPPAGAHWLGKGGLIGRIRNLQSGPSLLRIHRAALLPALLLCVPLLIAVPALGEESPVSITGETEAETVRPMPPTAPPPDLWPIAGGPGVITLPFGEQPHPFDKETTFHHDGIDITDARLAATPIRAAGAGAVSTVGWDLEGKGHYLLITHPGGWETFYSHLSKITVTEGQAVDRGESLGFMGSTGRSTGPHLHFEIRKGGMTADPLKIIPQP